MKSESKTFVRRNPTTLNSILRVTKTVGKDFVSRWKRLEHNCTNQQKFRRHDELFKFLSSQSRFRAVKSGKVSSI